MRKTIAFLVAFLAGIWSLPIGAVGTIPGFSLSQQLDTTGVPLGGGLLYLIQAGTTSTPQNCFQDTALTIPYPNPVVLDAYGRAPQLFCADGQIKVRLTDKNGVQKFVQDNLLIVGASSGGGGGGSVDPTTILGTGDLKIQYAAGPISGFVRANGRTIGSSTSGATERANLDVQALFSYLWGADSNLAVSGGRGASAAADWAANKTIALPDLRGRVIAGLDGMGNSTAGRIGSGAGSFGVNNNTLGAAGGAEVHTLVTANLPPYTPTGAVSADIPSTRNLNAVATGGTHSDPNTISVGNDANTTAGQFNLAASFAGNAQGGTSAALDTMSPAMLMTIYIKL